MVDEPINRMQFWVKRFSFSVDDHVPDLCFDFLMGWGALSVYSPIERPAPGLMLPEFQHRSGPGTRSASQKLPFW